MVTLPLTTDQIQQLFTSKEKERQVIDVVNSKLRGDVLCTYIANMQLVCSFGNAKELSFEEKEGLVKNFFEFKYAIECDTLVTTIADLLFKSRGLYSKYESFLSQEEVFKFIDNNKEVVDKYSNFLDSFLLTVPSFEKDFRLQVLEQIEQGVIEEVTDPDVIGVNILQLITVKGFLDGFLTTSDISNVKYYTYAIGKLHYKQKSIYDLMVGIGGDSLLFSFINIFSSEGEEEKEIREKLTEFVTNENV